MLFVARKGLKRIFFALEIFGFIKEFHHLCNSGNFINPVRDASV